jgi:hypothetical protein
MGLASAYISVGSSHGINTDLDSGIPVREPRCRPGPGGAPQT